MTENAVKPEKQQGNGSSSSSSSSSSAAAAGSQHAAATAAAGGPDAAQASGLSEPQAHVKKKQKRNKPTLSCEECVERKTKVVSDTSSPACCESRDGRLNLTTVAYSVHSVTEPGQPVWHA